MTYEQLWEEMENLNEARDSLVIIQTRISISKTLSKDDKAMLKKQLRGVSKFLCKEVHELYKQIFKIDKNFEAKEG